MLTTAELLFMEEHLRNNQAITRLTQEASENCSDPQLKSLCQQMLTDHQRQSQMLIRFLQPNMNERS